MSRHIQINELHTIFIDTKAGMVRINTPDWTMVQPVLGPAPVPPQPDPYSDIHQAVQLQIAHWMSGVNSVSYLMDRLTVHKLDPVLI